MWVISKPKAGKKKKKQKAGIVRDALTLGDDEKRVFQVIFSVMPVLEVETKMKAHICHV